MVQANSLIREHARKRGARSQLLIWLSRVALSCAASGVASGWAGHGGVAHAQPAQPAQRVARAERSPNSGWPSERHCGNLICHATFPLERVSAALKDLTELQRDLTTELGVPASEQPAHAFLFHNRSSYHSYLKRHLPHIARRQALYVKEANGPGMIFVHYHRGIEVDLRHESTHALLHAVLPMVPLWLDEGLAEYFEAPRKQRARGNSHLRPIKWESRLGRVPDLRDLERLAKMEAMSGADYRDAWAWVHFMLHGSPAGKKELQAFLADIAAYRPPGSLADRLRQRVPNLEAKYLQHFRHWK